MDACQSVERDINNVADKFNNLGESNQRILEEAIQLVRAAKDEIRDGRVFLKPKHNIRIGCAIVLHILLKNDQ